MKGKPEVIQALNNYLTELHSSLIVFTVCSSLCKKWGYLEIASKFDHIAKEDSELIGKVISRIVFLDGLPLFYKVKDDILIPETVEEMLIAAKELRFNNIASLSVAIAVCFEYKDYSTRLLMEKLLIEEDELLAGIEAGIIQFSERGIA